MPIWLEDWKKRKKKLIDLFDLFDLFETSHRPNHRHEAVDPATGPWPAGYFHDYYAFNVRKKEKEEKKRKKKKASLRPSSRRLSPLPLFSLSLSLLPSAPPKTLNP